MGRVSYTPAQRRAIEARGGDMLVSAAAGSGKTSVLSARIAALVGEGEEIRRMLVVTFTSKAAMEMRGRIRRTLFDAAREQDAPHLAMQAEQVDSADICTIHSFAAKVIREHFAELGLGAGVHAAGEEQTQIYRAEAMEEALTELYAAEDADFLLLRDRYSGRDDAQIVSELLRVYSYCMSRPEGLSWLENGAVPTEEAYLRVVAEQNQASLGRLCDALSACVRLGEGEDFPEVQRQKDAEDLALAERLQALYAADEAAYEAALRGAKIPAISRKIPEGEGKTRLQEYKKQARAQLKRLQGEPPTAAREHIRREIPYLRETCRQIARVLSCFAAHYTAIKRERGVIDYDDMLSLAYAALSRPDIAASYDARYSHVFVDEYQDTNPIQEAMLACLSPRGGRFFVGDMKQSIYRFRLSDPLIFREKMAEGSGVEVVRMHDNFRSAAGVVDAVNFFMERLLSPHLGELSYTAEEALVAAAPGEGRAEMLLTRADAARDAREAAEWEAETIARRVEELLSERTPEGTPRYRQEDICLLLRFMEGYAGIYAEALSRHGVDIRLNTGVDNFPAASEMFLNLLRVIDGYTSDIALLSVLKSFMGGFADADLAHIRAGAPADSFCESFLAYAAGEDALAEKCRAFCQKIETYRTWAAVMTLTDLLLRLSLTEEYEAHLLAMPGGEAKAKTFRDFLDKMLDWAAERTDLFDLLEYTRQVLRTQGGFPRSAGEAAGAVQILSIHGAKGLEFPVVIVARMGARFSVRDKRAAFLLHDRLGISADEVDEVHRRIHPTMLRELAEYAQQKEQRSEELRVLYVAMTRAKERLILSAAVRAPEERWEALRGKTRWYELLDMPSPLDWILAAAGELSAFGGQGEAGVRIPCRIVEGGARENETAIPRMLAQYRVLEEAAQMPAQEFLQYPSQGLPVKIGVSTLLPESEEGAAIPAYIGRGDAGAQLGTLIHLFLQHVDFASGGEAELSATMERLLRKRILRPEEAARIRPFLGKIAEFLHSPLADRIRASGDVRREVAFSLLLPARELGLADSGEKVLLQGILDLVFEEDGKFVIVDYKSNMASEQQLQSLARHYAAQMRFYRLAVERITGRPVAACYLWFLRQEKAFAVYSQTGQGLDMV